MALMDCTHVSFQVLVLFNIDAPLHYNSSSSPATRRGILKSWRNSTREQIARRILVISDLAQMGLNLQDGRILIISVSVHAWTSMFRVLLAELGVLRRLRAASLDQDARKSDERCGINMRHHQIGGSTRMGE